MVKVRHSSLKFDWKLKMSFSFHSETLGLKQHLEENPTKSPTKNRHPHCGRMFDVFQFFCEAP